ncbi:MAG: helix-turn-helix transcriptional regulator [Lactobacillaceae bacterium]|jgi:transcriptional regulator with XRE-family HTH domain|nr:helix-turn-helix transcriptional regulator [Lactobacillaceae bacterium]
MTKFASELMRKTREDKNMTAEQLGEMIGTSKATISRYENGKRLPNLEMIGEISNALGLETVQLIKGDQMTLSQTYQLTLRQEVLREIAAGIQAKLIKVILMQRNDSEKSTLKLLRSQMSRVKNDTILDAENQQELDKIDGYLTMMGELVNNLFEEMKNGVAK